MTDPSQGQPSEEEIRAYMQQIREADPAAIVVQSYRMLAEGAELKLGRPDARVLIDAMGALVQTADGRLDAQLVGQMREGVVQLQTAQVQAERDEAGQAGAAQPSAAQAGAAQAGAGQPGAAQPAAGQPRPGAPGTPPQGGQQQDTQPLTDRLWIPGRGPSKP